MNLPQRKTIRLKGYNYSAPGVYFITICTKDREEMLSEIISGTGIPEESQNILTEYGETAYRQLVIMSDFYDNVRIDKFVVMPNHIHLLIRILDPGCVTSFAGRYLNGGMGVISPRTMNPAYCERVGTVIPDGPPQKNMDLRTGASGTTLPTEAMIATNPAIFAPLPIVYSVISKFIGTFKRFCRKEYGFNIWQSGSYDHIVRDEQDYKRIWEYIDSNVTKWTDDCFYIKKTEQ